MSHIKITCPGPKVEGSFIQYPGAGDAKLLLVRDDGTEEDISDQVARITWDLKAGDIAKATVEFIGVEADVTGVLDEPGKPPL